MAERLETFFKRWETVLARGSLVAALTTSLPGSVGSHALKTIFESLRLSRHSLQRNGMLLHNLVQFRSLRIFHRQERGNNRLNMWHMLYKSLFQRSAAVYCLPER